MRIRDRDIQPRSEGRRHPRDGSSIHRRSSQLRTSALSANQAGAALGEWKQQELRVVRGFAECRGLSTEQLEDIYQDTTLALLKRSYTNEEHLRNALRIGVKQRSLRLHRDERRRLQILTRNAHSFRTDAQTSEEHSTPETLAVAQEDRLIASEFVTELNERERRVFGCLVEGLQYRAIASTLDITPNQARNTVRSCERKREHFQLLYDTGRLCGYRAQTIRLLQDGQSTSEELAERAFAHLESCAHCRLEHKTNALRLRSSFREQAAALLPPIAFGHFAWLERLTMRGRLLLHRFGIGSLQASQSGVRERVATLLAGTGATAKIAAGVITVSALAGGALATHAALKHPHSTSHIAVSEHHPSVPPTPIGHALYSPVDQNTKERVGVAKQTRGRRSRSAPKHTSNKASRYVEPGGFAYLGVPATQVRPGESPGQTSSQEERNNGGQFSP